jgi:clan AA aspartic protease (TIGR02281 family)
MSASTAQGMRLPYEAGRSITMQTANGTKSARLVSISSVRVGNIVLNDVLGAVSDAEMPLLLGMSFLGRLNVSIKQGSMTLASPELGSPVNVVERKPPQED